MLSPIMRRKHLQRALDRLVEIQDLPGDGLLARERQQLARQVGRPFCGTLDFPEIGAERQRRIRVLERQLHVSHDHAEHVVEVVRHASRQPPDRLHLLRLEQLRLKGFLLRFRPLAFGDVAARHHESVRLARGVGDDPAGGLQPDPAAVGLAVAILHFRRNAHGERGGVDGLNGGEVVRVNPLEGRVANERGGLESQHGPERRADIPIPRVAIRLGDEVGHALGDATEALLARQQRLLGLLAVVDVAGHREDVRLAAQRDHAR